MRDRVRLRVRPLSVMAIATGDQGYGIEVVKLSSFPVTVEEGGFTLNARSATRGERLVVLVPINSDGGPWPRRLEPRTTVTVYFDERSLGQLRGRISKVDAKTACRESCIRHNGGTRVTSTKSECLRSSPDQEHQRVARQVGPAVSVPGNKNTSQTDGKKQ